MEFQRLGLGFEFLGASPQHENCWPEDHGGDTPVGDKRVFDADGIEEDAGGVGEDETSKSRAAVC
jgi:hypothetical protein